MTWTHTSRGRALDLLAPTIDDVDLREIAGALGRQCRYNGCVSRFYSVAEHSVLIAQHLSREGHPRDVVIAGLLHDAAEAYTGDLTWPVQEVLWAVAPEARRAYKAVQRGLDALICQHARIDPDLLYCDEVKARDLRILLDEREALLHGRPRQWFVDGPGWEPLGVTIIGLSPMDAACAFRDALEWLEVKP